MIDTTDLDNVKLVDGSKLSSADVALDYVERSVQQAQGAWSITEQDAVILRLAYDLRVALTVVDTVVEAQNALKGEQMARGRAVGQYNSAKDRIEALEGQLEDADDIIVTRDGEIEALQERLDTAAGLMGDT